MTNVVSVSEFLSQINGIIAGQFTIEGEVSQYKISQGKWIFFDLKDETSTLNCFSTVFMMKQPLEDGMRVRVTGYPKIHEPSGRFSFTVQLVELVGEGTLARAYKLLKAKLTAEGLFVPERKRLLPKFPSTIGVIASRDSAAWGDFKRILSNRWGGVTVVLRHVLVQGEGAVEDITAALKEFNEAPALADVLVIIRGGGSPEDLAAFNSETVVRAVAASRIPTICGVGHERDESLADLAADVRASTPSNAAEIVVPERREIISELEFSLDHMVSALRQTAHAYDRNLTEFKQTMIYQIRGTIANSWAVVESAERLFKNLDPKRVLERGYSITRDAGGRVVTDSRNVDIGAEIVVELAKGTLETKLLRKQ